MAIGRMKRAFKIAISYRIHYDGNSVISLILRSIEYFVEINVAKMFISDFITTPLLYGIAYTCQ